VGILTYTNHYWLTQIWMVQKVNVHQCSYWNGTVKIRVTPGMMFLSWKNRVTCWTKYLFDGYYIYIEIDRNNRNICGIIRANYIILHITINFSACHLWVEDKFPCKCLYTRTQFRTQHKWKKKHKLSLDLRSRSMSWLYNFHAALFQNKDPTFPNWFLYILLVTFNPHSIPISKG